MLFQVSGTVLSQNTDSVIVDVNGIGLELFVPRPQRFTKGTAKTLYTHLHWNQETGPSLYGFATREEQHIFSLIKKCSGVGPKLGIAVLEHMQPQEFIKIIMQENVAGLSTIPGIGKKKAESIIMQLKDKIDDHMLTGSPDDPMLKNITDIQHVLISLNYSRSEIQEALDLIKQSHDPQQTFDQSLRKALSYLSRKK